MRIDNKSSKIDKDMKKILKSTLLLLCGIGLFTACADDRDSNPTLQQPTTFVLNTPAYSTSNVDLATSTGIPFTWNSPNYGFPVACTYQLQVSKDGNFTVDLASVDEDHQSDANYATIDDVFTEAKGTLGASKLSRAINAINGWTETAPDVATVFVRAKAELTGTQTVYSNTVQIKVVPNLVVAPSFAEYIYEIGNESGWSTAYPMRSPNQDGIYQSYNYLDGAFKFKPNADNWTGDWGQNPSGAYGDLVEDGEEDCNKADGAFPDEVKPAGFYQIDVDITTMKWSITAVNSITMVGDFNGWNQADAEMHMAYNQAEGCWQMTYTFAADAQVKFAMNDDWSTSWGGADGDGSNYGNLTQYSGANLEVPAGTYTVKLYLSYEGNNKVEFNQ